MKQIYRVSITSTIGICFLLLTNRTQAQIVTDTTLTTNSEVISPQTNLEQVQGGTVAGSNLFHSFEKFSINEGAKVDFVSPSSAIANILVRVTGENPSEIKGTLATSGLSEPNFFLMNPNGILFGPQARLDIRGSFVATTANAIQFGDGNTFSASVPNNPELLTINPSAFLFNQIKSAPIINQSTVLTGLTSIGLKVPNGKSLLLVGGDVNLENGGLNTQGGYIELGGLAGSGSIGLNTSTNILKLNFPENTLLGNVSLTNNAEINASGQDGKIVINSQNFRLDESSLSVGLSKLNNQEANLIINTRGNINAINSNIYSGGSNININAADILFDTTLLSNSALDINGGDININARNSLNLVNSVISSDSYGIGNGGTINIDTESLSLSDGAVVYTRALDEGDAGNINVNASDINIVGVNLDQGFSSGLLTASEEENSGRGGNIEINTGRISISQGGVLSARTRSSSPGGKISINANQVELLDGGQILTSTFNSGNAGDIDIKANSVQISGNDPTYFERLDQLRNSGADPFRIVDNDSSASGLFARARSDAASSGGNIQVIANSINLDEQATISSATTTGNGGNISIQNFQLLELRNNSQISTTAGTANSPGNGGNITIESPNGFIVAVAEENSDITANAYNGQGGIIQIDVKGLYGFKANQQLTVSSDITAFSQFNPQLNGVVEIDTSAVEPYRGLVELPSVPDNIRLAQTCQSNIAANQSSFSIIGRSGLPPNPKEVLSSDAVQVDWLLPRASNQNKIASAVKISIPPQPVEIIEANTLVRNSKGEILLTANELPQNQSDVLLSRPQCH
jgi:filamentous hemagglutinin family protein